MKPLQMRTLVLLALLSITGLAPAWEIDGQTALLVVSEHRVGDTKLEEIKNELLAARERMGYDKETMPVVFMGFKDSDTERKYFDRLGFQAIDSPVVAVVEWGNPARFGPKRIIGHGIKRHATAGDVETLIGHYLKAIDKTLVEPAPSTLSFKEIVEVVSVRFKVRGKPLFLTSMGIRVRNTQNLTLKDIQVRYYGKLRQDEEWELLGERTLEDLPPGNFASRDLVVKSQGSRLLDQEQNPLPCLYKIECEYRGERLTEEGEFAP
jgi:hypothetical protein